MEVHLSFCDYYMNRKFERAGEWSSLDIYQSIYYNIYCSFCGQFECSCGYYNIQALSCVVAFEYSFSNGPVYMFVGVIESVLHV